MLMESLLECPEKALSLTQLRLYVILKNEVACHFKAF